MTRVFALIVATGLTAALFFAVSPAAAQGGAPFISHGVGHLRGAAG